MDMIGHASPSLRRYCVTGQVSFDSHARSVLAASVEYVNRLTPGYSGGVAYAAPADDPAAITEAVAQALTAIGHPPKSVPVDDARRLKQLAGRMRLIFEAAAAD